jgi:hypothetical protein
LTSQRRRNKLPADPPLPRPGLPGQTLYRWLTNSAIPELARLAATIDSWRTELLAYFTTGGNSNDPPKPSTLLIRTQAHQAEVAPGVLEFEVSVPRLAPTLR